MRLRIFMLLALSLLPGCRGWIQTRLDLVDQARRGIALGAGDLTDQARVADELTVLRRRLLDQAFDQDARAQATLTPEWVIEARQAYAVGLTALEDQRRSHSSARLVAADNLTAADQALERLRWLDELELHSLDRLTAAFRARRDSATTRP